MTLWLALAALWLPRQDTVGVSVQLSQTRVAAGEVVVWDVTVMTPGGTPDDIRLPQLSGGLRIEGTRRYDEYSIRFPGGRIRTTRVEVHIRPRRPGRYAIPPVVVTYEGRRYSSRSLTLEVVDAAAAATLPGYGVPAVEGYDRAAVGPDAEALLRARLEPDTVWVGQQATLVVDALVSNELRARLRRAPEYLTPSVSGMWTQDLPDVAGTRVEWSGPRRYEVQTFRRAYFPLEPGTFDVPEARLVYEARRGFLFTPYTEELTTPALHLVVRPLPAAGVPASFAGAVGDYAVSATIAPADLAVGDAALLTVVVRGSGNLKSLPAPRVPPAAVHLDTPTEDASVDGAGGVVSGTKSFTWVVVPERAGRIEIGPIEYGFFDPAVAEYRVARTSVLTLEVAPADPTRDPIARAPAVLLPLRTAPARDPFGGLRGAALLALALAPVAVAGSALALRRRRERARIAPPRRVLRRRLRDRLNVLVRPDMIGDASFFTRLDDAVREWLSDRFASHSMRILTGSELAAVLEGAGVPAPLASATRDLLERIARAPFQPTAPAIDERLRIVDRVRETVDRVDRVAPGGRRGRRTRAPALLLLIAWLPVEAAAQSTEAAAPMSPAPAPAPRTLEEIAAAFADGQRDQAADGARAWVRAHPRDASGWYDLGTIEAARERRGVATWALLRALELDPRASDVRANLDVLGVDPAARRAVAPALPLRPGETRAFALGAWWLALLLALPAVVRRSRGWMFGSACAAAFALVLAGLAVAPRVLPDVAVPLGPGVQLRAAPHLHAPVLGPAEEGALLRVVEQRDAWLRVRARDGDEGWIEARDAGIV